MAEAPGRLELVRRFVNTLDVDSCVDSLDSPQALKEWLTSNRVLSPDATVDAGALGTFHELRETLRVLAHANAHCQSDPAALGRLDEIASGLPVRLTFGAEAGLTPACAGTDAAAAEVLSIVHQAMADGTWPRFKACKAETCAWAYYDHSRNRSATWCSIRS